MRPDKGHSEKLPSKPLEDLEKTDERDKKTWETVAIESYNVT